MRRYINLDDPEDEFVRAGLLLHGHLDPDRALRPRPAHLELAQRVEQQVSIIARQNDKNAQKNSYI